MVKLKGLLILIILFLGSLLVGIVLGLKMPAGYQSPGTEIVTENVSREIEQSENLIYPSESDTLIQAIYPDSEDIDSGVILDSLSIDTLSGDRQITVTVSEPEIITSVDSTNEVNQVVEDLEEFEDVDITDSINPITDSLPIDTSFQHLDTLEDF
jgi:hypothetical protein